MRLQQYLITEGRSKDIPNYTVDKLLRKNCMDAVNSYRKGNGIFRGVDGGGQYLFVNPSVGKPRKSRNTQNYYTLMVDNSPKWKGYPKRSQSLICTTNSDVANSYGNPYAVFPYDGAKIGVCPDVDFWASFEQTGVTSASAMNQIISELYTEIDNETFMPKTYKDMLKGFKEIDTYYKDKKDVFNSIIHKNYSNYNIWIKKYNGDMKDTFEKTLDPVKNDFRLLNLGDRIGCNDCEVWVSSACVLVHRDEADMFAFNAVNPE